MKSLKPSIAKNFLLNTIYQILTVITPFITAPYLARVLGAEQIGVSSFSYSIVAYFTLFASLGTLTYGAREISRTRDNKPVYSKLFWEIEMVSIISSSVMVVLWLILVICVKKYQILFLILTITLMTAMFDISWFFIGLEQFKYTVTRNCIVKISGVILILTLVKKPEDLWIFLSINSVTGLLGNLSMWPSLKKFLAPVDRHTLNIKPHFKETFVYFIPTIASSIYQVLDKTLIGLITKDSAQNGYYEEAIKLITLIKSLCYSSLSSVMESRNAFLFEQKQYDEIRDNIYKTFDFIMFMSIGACFGLFGISNVFIPFFLGTEFTPTVLLLKLLSPTLIIIAISTCSSCLYYIPGGYRKQSNYFIITGALLNLICNLIFIPHFKSVGAIGATLFAETVISLLFIIFSKGFISFRLIFRCSYKKLISAALMLLFILFVQNLNLHRWFILLIQVAGGIFIYCGLLLILKDGNVYILFTKIKEKIFKRKSN